MKKLALFPILILLTLSSCKKTKTNEVTIEATWASKTVMADYYNSSNTKIFTENEPYDAVWSFTSSNLTLAVAGVPQNIKTKYTIATNASVKTITLDADIGFINQFDITSMTATSMTWSAQNTDPINLVYFENNIPKISAKVIYTINFTKK